MDLLHKNKSFVSLRLHSLLFLFLRVYVLFVHFRPTQIRCLGFASQKQVVRFTTFALTFVFVTSGLRSLRSHSPYTNPLSWICFTKTTSSVKIMSKCCFMVFYIRIWGKLRFLSMSRRTTGIGLSFRQPYIPLLQHLRRS